jgi:hypothetical protein
MGIRIRSVALFWRQILAGYSVFIAVQVVRIALISLGAGIPAIARVGTTWRVSD